MERSDSLGSLDKIEAGELASQDIVEAFEDAYTAAATRIRAVGKIINDGKRVTNLNVAVESMKENVRTMIATNNAAKKLYTEEAHCCCDRPRSEVLTLAGHVANWTSGLTAIGFSVAGLQEDKKDTTTSAGRSIATFSLGIFQLFQGWVADKKLEQVAYEEDLLLLLKTAPGRVKYVRSMIAIFESWDSYQRVANAQGGVGDEGAQVKQIISTIEQLPVRSKEEGGFCRRDMFDALMQTENGRALYAKSEQLQQYKKLVDAEYRKGGSQLADSRDISEDEVDFEAFDDDGFTRCRSARQYLKEKKADRNPAKKYRHHRGELRGDRRTQDAAMGTLDRSSTNRTLRRTHSASSGNALKEEDLEEFVSNSCCFYVYWDIPRLTRKIEGKYRTAETETSAVGTALKTHGASVDFQTSIATLDEILTPIETLERVAKHILDTDKKLPAMAGLKAQQHYRTALSILLTLISFGTSTAETVVEFTEDEPDKKLKVISFISLLLAQTGTLVDTKMQTNIFNKMRQQNELRSILARKYSKTISAMIKYWERCQRAIETGGDSDVEIAFQTRAPASMLTAISMTDVANHILTQHKKVVEEDRERKRSTMMLEAASPPPQVERFEDSQAYKSGMAEIEKMKDHLQRLQEEMQEAARKHAESKSRQAEAMPVRSLRQASTHEEYEMAEYDSPNAQMEAEPRMMMSEASLDTGREEARMEAEMREREAKMQAIRQELLAKQAALQEQARAAQVAAEEAAKATAERLRVQSEEAERLIATQEEQEKARAEQFDARVKELVSAATERETSRRLLGPPELERDKTEVTEVELDLMWAEVDSEEETEWSRRLNRLEKVELKRREASREEKKKINSVESYV